MNFNAKRFPRSSQSWCRYDTSARSPENFPVSAQNVTRARPHPVIPGNLFRNYTRNASGVNIIFLRKERTKVPSFSRNSGNRVNIPATSVERLCRFSEAPVADQATQTKNFNKVREEVSRVEH